MSSPGRPAGQAAPAAGGRPLRSPTAADVYTVAVDLFRQPDALALAESPPWVRSRNRPTVRPAARPGAAGARPSAAGRRGDGHRPPKQQLGDTIELTLSPTLREV